MSDKPTSKNDFIHALKHITDDEPVNASILYGLSLMSKANLASFSAVWPDIKPNRRLIIMQKLVEITEQSFEVSFNPIFILGLDDSSPEVQVAAIEGLWEMESPALAPPLIHLMKAGQTVAVRAKAATALGQFIYLGELEEIDSSVHMIVEQALLETIRQEEEDIEVIRRAIEAIAFSGSEGIDTIIEQAYHHEDERMQVSAVFAMGRNYNSEKWGLKVIDELDNPSEAIRFEAARSAGELQFKPAVKKLIRLIESEDNLEIVQNAIWSLGQIGGYEAQETLEALCESSDEAISEVAEEALDELLIMGSVSSDMFDFDADDDDDDDDDDGYFDYGNDQDFETYHLN